MNRAQGRALNKYLRRRMGLAKYLTRWVDVPHEPGERFKFRMPNWTTIEEARAERRRGVYTMMRETQDIVGSEILREWKEEAERNKDETAIVPAPTAEDLLNEFDRLMLLKAGIAGWTYCEPLTDAEGNPRYDAAGHLLPDRTKPLEVSTDNIRDLDEQTQKWAGLTLIALVQSGFRPVMPEVERGEHGTVIDIRPGVDPDPLAYSSNSTSPLMESRA